MALKLNIQQVTFDNYVQENINDLGTFWDTLSKVDRARNNFRFVQI